MLSPVRLDEKALSSMYKGFRICDERKGLVEAQTRAPGPPPRATDGAGGGGVWAGRGMGARGLLAAGAGLRAGLLALAAWADARAAAAGDPAYTDVDYGVYTAGALAVARGGSPFEDPGKLTSFRYSPLVAYAALPNIWVHPASGKVLFCLCDLIIAWLLIALERHRSRGHAQELREGGAGLDLAGASLWLFCPYTAAISTRGSCDSLSSALLVGMLWCLEANREGAEWRTVALAGASVLYGTAVHLRVFPIIYCVPLFLWLHSSYRSSAAGGAPVPLWKKILQPNKSQVAFGVLSAATFLGLTGLFYYLYGEPYIDEALFYHFGRVDTAHNFSPWFYIMGAVEGTQWGGLSAAHVLGLAAFAPQALLCVFLGVSLHDDLASALALQTVAFVALNKVITAQYFAWYLALLPLCTHHIVRKLRVDASRGPLWRAPLVLASAAWVVAQIQWLGWAYLLEFRRRSVRAAVFIASVAFLAAHLWLARELWLCVRLPRRAKTA